MPLGVPLPGAGPDTSGGNDPTRSAALSNLRMLQSNNPSQMPLQGAAGQAAPAMGGGQQLGSILAQAIDIFTQMASSGQLPTAVELVTQFFETLQSMAPQQPQASPEQASAGVGALPAQSAQAAPRPGTPLG